MAPKCHGRQSTGSLQLSSSALASAETQGNNQDPRVRKVCVMCGFSKCCRTASPLGYPLRSHSHVDRRHLRRTRVIKGNIRNMAAPSSFETAGGSPVVPTNEQSAYASDNKHKK